MPEDRRSAGRPARTPPDTPRPAQRIPLPPLHRRQPAPGSTVDPAPGEFLAPAPSPADAPPVEPDRTGSSGAAILDALVDEIERDLDRENGRHDPSAPAASYRIILACSSLAPPSLQTPGRRKAPAGSKGR